MITTTNIIYSVSAVRRILGIYYPETAYFGENNSSQKCLIKIRIQVWKSVVWVRVEGHRPTLVSKSVFKNHFVSWRKQQAKGLKVIPHPFQRERFAVHNEAKGTVYNVVASVTGVHCNCDDYKNQLKFFGKGCCKHGHALLENLGFNSLESYLRSKQLVAVAA